MSSADPCEPCLQSTLGTQVKDSFSANWPWNILGTFSVSTGYFQDRLLPSVTFVYDVQSVSGASLPQITYRYNEAFSITFGHCS